ncbi:flagellar hook-length control protein FliK [Chelativorans sp. YIM 93263]|uniref:flagellar hook-length control protein FliK n=1 Tax=Chelativorans sp. YIM 93263 TaxID=2906648 RepID=UPI00237858CF|nr:flagellar hook-length control protein FliK [Chelativorans sp. YIM 93263]
MTDGIIAGGRLFPADTRNLDPAGKDRPSDPLAFKSVLRENATTPARDDEANALEQEMNQRGWRLADLLEKITVAEHHEEADTDHHAMSPKDPEGQVGQNGGTEEKSSVVVEATSELRISEPNNVEEDGHEHEAASDNLAEPLSMASRPTDIHRLPTARMDTDVSAVKKEKSGLSEVLTRQGQAAPEPEIAAKIQKTSSSGTEHGLQQTATQSKARAESFLSEQGDKREGQNPDRQNHGSESGRKPVRVITTQTTPAPAASVGAQPLPPNSPLSSSVTNALTADPGFGTAAAEAAKAIASSQGSGSQTLHTLKIQLHPVELGAVTAKLSASGEQLIVELSVESAEARQKLNADSEAMTRALRGLGYEVDRVTIQQTSNPTPTATTPGSAGRDTGGFSAGNDGGRQPDGNAGGKQQNQGGAGRERSQEDSANAQARSSLYI